MIWRFADLDDVGVRFLLGFASVDSCSLPSVCLQPLKGSLQPHVCNTHVDGKLQKVCSLLQCCLCCVGIRRHGIGFHAQIHIIS